MSESQKTARWLTQSGIARERWPRPHWLVLSYGALGLGSACLDPAISDEPPISQSMLAADVADAGAGLVEPSSEAAPAPAATWPRPSRGNDDRVRGPRRR